MIAPKNARKNPTMGQVDESVRDAGARQAYEESAGESGSQYQQPPPPPPEPEPKYQTYVDARPAADEQVAEVAAVAGTGPLAMLARVMSMPWYAWLGVAALGIFVVSVVQEERAASNPDDEDADDDPESDVDDDEFEEDDKDDDPDEESFDDDETAPPRRPWARSAGRGAARSSRGERVVEDDLGDQEPEESVVG